LEAEEAIASDFSLTELSEAQSFCLIFRPCPVECGAYLTGVKKSDKIFNLRGPCGLELYRLSGRAGERKQQSEIFNRSLTCIVKLGLPA